MIKLTRVLICGTGSGAHALAAVASRNGFDVCVLSQNAGKAQRWNESLERQPLAVIGRNGDGAWMANSFSVTDDPAVAARGCDLIIFAVPTFSHERYLELLKPEIRDGCVIVGLPGQNGFEFEVRNTLGPRLRNCAVINFESLPWSCRVVDFGATVRINGTKKTLVGAIQGDLPKFKVNQVLETLQGVLGEFPKLILSGHLLGINLMSLNAYSHPPIMYGRWKDWDGKPLDHEPLFFQGVDENTAGLLEKISDEVVAISRRIMAEYPIDLSQVVRMYDWDIAHYSDQIADKTNLMTALRTNALYQGRAHPMVQTSNGQYIPDFNHRFLLEDIPCLAVIRGIAEIAGVETPNLDMVLLWGQGKLDKEYLVGSKLIGKDLATTRCPQRYGITTIEELLGYKNHAPRVIAMSAAISNASVAARSEVMSELS
ncbi:MAG TPA: NAD/NADP octopine/nopaline dehydrogenase family protein [Pyrinomonadaceae bacterium]|jgi:ketopantoate reductase